MEPFRFKQFTIHQKQSAMKVGTDAVLLGAWTKVEPQTESILDVGAGTGLIALMLAQRSDAGLIDAVELVPEAYQECVENFERSPWNDRLFCYHASIQEFAAEMDERYDLIVSNPPFHTENYKTKSAARDTARFTDVLPFRHLINCVARLLSTEGKFAVIIPTNATTIFLTESEKYGLHLTRSCKVRGNPHSDYKRILMELSRNKPASVLEGSLTIETDRHCYSDSYRELVKDFYLKL